MLRLRTLGGLSVEADGRIPSGAATQPRRLAVLALIGTAGERGITRDRLIALLWTDTPEESARRALAQALHALRHDLDADELFTGVQELRLNPAAMSCDVVDFEAALAARDLDRAAAAYGGPFLDGFRVAGAPEFERWVEEERTRLARRHADALERLALAATTRGDALAAVQAWRRLAALDPLNARVAVELMQALAAAGERHAALQHARIYEALVEQELAIEPDRAVLALAESLRQEPGPAATSATSAPAVAAAPVPAGAAVPVPAEAALRAPAAVPAEAPAVAAPAGPAPGVAAHARHRRALWFAAGLVLLMVGLAAVARQTRPRGAAPLLAVGRIADYRAEGGAGDPVGEMLATNLARVAGLQVLSSARVLELLRDGDAGGDAGALARAARRAGATELIEGGVHRLDGGRLLLELRRVTLPGGAIRTAYRLEGTDIFEVVGRATGEIAASFGRGGTALDPGDASTRSLVAFRFYEEGLREFARGDFRAAAQLFDAALREDSTFALAAYYRWHALIARNVYVEPDELHRMRALAARAPDRERLLIGGWVAMAFDEAGLDALADTFATRYPAELDGHYLRGFAHLRHGEYAAALPHLQRVVALDSAALRGGSPRCLACDALQQIIGAHVAMDSLAAAERTARDWTRRDPASSRAWVALSGVLGTQARYDEALDARRRATGRGPFDAHDPVFPAALRLRAGDYDEAERLALPLLQAAPDAETLWQAAWLLMLQYRLQGRWREALALAQQHAARAEGPARTDRLRIITMLEALVHLEAGRAAQAAAIWDTLATTRSADDGEGPRIRRAVLSYALAAAAHDAAGDSLRLRAAADSATALAARSANRRDAYFAAHARGLLARARGDTAGAIAEFSHAMYAPVGGFTRTNHDLAELWLRQNQPQRAIPLLQAALRGIFENTNLYVDRIALHELLAEAHVRTGQRDSAAYHYRRITDALARCDAEAVPRRARAERALAALMTSPP